MRTPSPFSTFSLPKIPGATRLDPGSGSLAGERKNEAPFTNSVQAKKPVAPGYTQAQVDASLKANPSAAGANGSNFTGDFRAASNSARSGGPPGQSIYDLSTDPIVQRIRDLGTRNYGQAVASADAGRKQLLIDSGFSDIAKATQFGALETPQTGDEATALAAAANPFSIAANLKLAHERDQQGIDLGANRSNLFYSSTRGNQLGDEAHSYLGNLSSAENSLRRQLTDIVQSLLGVKAQNQQGEADAFSTARQNAINNAIASGESFVGYDKDGNPIFANTGGTASAAPAAAFSPPPPSPAGSATSPLLASIAASNRTKKLLGIEV